MAEVTEIVGKAAEITEIGRRINALEEMKNQLKGSDSMREIARRVSQHPFDTDSVQRILAEDIVAGIDRRIETFAGQIQIIAESMSPPKAGYVAGDVERQEAARLHLVRAHEAHRAANEE